MSDNLQVYTNALVSVEGALLTEAGTITIKRSSGANPVKTIHKGFAGMCPGAPMMELDVSNAVPSADFEFDPGKFIRFNVPLEFTIEAAGKSLTTKGFIPEDDFSYSTGAEAKLSFKAFCKIAEWA